MSEPTVTREAFAKWWMDAREIPAEYRTAVGYDMPGRTPREACRCPGDCDFGECTGWIMTIPDES